MKRTLTHLGLAVAITLAITLATATADLASSLSALANYQFGESKEPLHAARLAAFRGTHDAEVRAENERLLIGFLQSEASVAARREASLWLANIGTAASVPVLETLAQDERFADVASIALAEVSGQRPFTPSPAAAPPPPDVAAILGDDERAARMAIEAIATNTKDTAAQAWVTTNLAKLPPQRQIVAMNAMLRANAAASVDVVEALITSDHPEVRNAAIVAIGTLGRPQDATRLVAWLVNDDDETRQAAAHAALVAAPESAVRDILVAILHDGDATIQVKGIEIVAQRGATFAGEHLLRIAHDGFSLNRKSAIAALAWASPAESFDEIITHWIAAAGTPHESDWQATTWALARRQPDYPAAILTLQTRAEAAPPPTRTAIHAMAGRLESALPEVPLDTLRN